MCVGGWVGLMCVRCVGIGGGGIDKQVNASNITTAH